MECSFCWFYSWAHWTVFLSFLVTHWVSSWQLFWTLSVRSQSSVTSSLVSGGLLFSFCSVCCCASSWWVMSSFPASAFMVVPTFLIWARLWLLWFWGASGCISEPALSTLHCLCQRHRQCPLVLLVPARLLLMMSPQSWVLPLGSPGCKHLCWVSCSSTSSLWALHGLGCCCPVHHLCCCSQVIWGCWQYYYQRHSVHRCYCQWLRSGVSCAAPAAGRAGVRSAATRGWVTGTAVTPGASGCRCHPPLQGKGEGLSHKCHCWERGRGWAKTAVAARAASGLQCHCAFWNFRSGHHHKGYLHFRCTLAAGRAGVGVANTRGGHRGCFPSSTASQRSSPPTFRCLYVWISQGFWCAVHLLFVIRSPTGCNLEGRHNGNSSLCHDTDITPNFDFFVSFSFLSTLTQSWLLGRSFWTVNLCSQLSRRVEEGWHHL